MVCTPKEQRLHSILYRSIPWFRFQEQLERDFPLTGGSRISTSGTPTSDSSILANSVNEAYSFPSHDPLPIMYERSKRNTVSVPTVPQVEALMLDYLGNSKASPSQQSSAVSSLSTGVELVQAFIVLATNNALDDKPIGEFVEWVASSNRRWVLKTIFSYKTLTTEILATKLLVCASKTRYIGLVRFLLSVGADVNVRAPYWGSPLRNAILFGSVPLVELLLAKGAIINPLPVGYNDCTSLQHAVISGSSSEMVQLLLERGADVNARGISKSVRDYHEPTPPLGLAAKSNNNELVQILLKAGALIDCWSFEDGTALQTAAACDNMGIVRTLLAAGCNVDAPSGSLYAPHYDTHMFPHHTQAHISPLVHATRNGNIPMVQALLKAGAYADLCPKHQRKQFLWELAGVSPDLGETVRLVTNTALQTAVYEENLELVDILLSANASVDGQQCGDTPLQIAAQVNNIALARLLIAHGAKIDGFTDWPFGRTAVQAASGTGNIYLLQLLLSSVSNFMGFQSINAPPSQVGGRTALQAAAEQGHSELVTFLLDLGVSVNGPIAKKFGVSTLQPAARSGSLIVANLVCAAGADISTPLGTISALNTAVSQNDMPMFLLLLQHGMDINSQPVEHGRSTLQVAAMQESTTFLKLLISAGAEVNAWWEHGTETTALHTAVAHGALSAVQLLLQAGADPNLSARSGRESNSAGHQGGVHHVDKDLLRFDKDLTGLLLRYASDIMSICRRKRITLKDAIHALNMDWTLFHQYRFKDNINSRSYGSNALAIALGRRRMRDDEVELVQVLVDAKAKVNSRYCDSMSILGYAAAEYSSEVVRMLLVSGADPNWRYCLDDMTPLSCATWSADDEIIHMILDAGADINAPAGSGAGRTALQWAADVGNLGYVRLLLQRGADVNAPPGKVRGVTALQAASIEGHITIVILLLHAGADINGKKSESEGRTALEGAAEHGRLDIVSLLLENDHDMEDFYDRCKEAAYYAEREGHTVIARMLREYRKD